MICRICNGLGSTAGVLIVCDGDLCVPECADCKGTCRLHGPSAMPELLPSVREGDELAESPWTAWRDVGGEG